MCTRQYAHQMLLEIQQPEELLDIEVNVAWLQITLAELFFGEGKPGKYSTILEGEHNRRALEVQLKSNLHEARERLLMQPELCQHILDLAESCVQQNLYPAMTQNEKFLFAVAVDDVYFFMEDRALSYEIIMTIAEWRRPGPDPFD